jgi:hypothetical protein
MVALLGLLIFLILWRGLLDWWARPVAFSTLDLAALTVISGLLGSGLTSNQKTAILTVGLGLIPAVFVFSWTLKQLNQRKREIWNAIKAWVELPITEFRDKRDRLPLAETPPEKASEIEDCLRRSHSAIWDNLQRLRQQYHEWKNENTSDRFTRIINGVETVYVDAVPDYDKSTPERLLRIHSALTEQIKSEILAKPYASLNW